MTQKPTQSPWKKLMTTALSKSRIPVANVLMFGDESSGKRSLLNALLASENQKNEINLKYETAQTSERKK